MITQNQDGNTLVIDGEVNEIKCNLTLDTGASRTVIRHQPLRSFFKKNSNSLPNIQLLTATGQHITVRGEGIATFKVGGNLYRHKTLNADIVEDCIIGLDFMKSHNCKIDFENGIFQFGPEKVSLKKCYSIYDNNFYQALTEEKMQSNWNGECDVDLKHCIRQEEKELVKVKLIRTDTNSPDWCSRTIQEAQEEDNDIKPVLNWMKSSNHKPKWSDIAATSNTTKSYWAQWDSLVLHNGVLTRKWENTNGNLTHQQLIVPRSKVRVILEMFHNGTSAGHLGLKKTLTKIRERFYWIHCREDVKDWCRKCTVCAAVKGPKIRRRAGKKQYNVGAPGDRIAVDIAGPFPLTGQVIELRQGLQVIHELVRDAEIKMSERMKTRYDRHIHRMNFDEGSLVWLHNPTRRKGKSPKLEADWDGPYTVITKINDMTFCIKKMVSFRSTPKIVHVNRLARFNGPNDARDEHV